MIRLKQTQLKQALRICYMFGGRRWAVVLNTTDRTDAEMKAIMLGAERPFVIEQVWLQPDHMWTNQSGSLETPEVNHPVEMENLDVIRTNRRVPKIKCHAKNSAQGSLF